MTDTTPAFSTTSSPVVLEALKTACKKAVNTRRKAINDHQKAVDDLRYQRAVILEAEGVINALREDIFKIDSPPNGRDAVGDTWGPIEDYSNHGDFYTPCPGPIRYFPEAPPPIQSALEELKKAMTADPELAWGWHCNIAMPIQDATSITSRAANKAACDLMRHLFDIDMSQHEHYLGLMRTFDADDATDGKPIDLGNELFDGLVSTGFLEHFASEWHCRDETRQAYGHAVLDWGDSESIAHRRAQGYTETKLYRTVGQGGVTVGRMLTTRSNRFREPGPTAEAPTALYSSDATSEQEAEPFNELRLNLGELAEGTQVDVIVTAPGESHAIKTYKTTAHARATVHGTVAISDTVPVGDDPVRVYLDGTIARDVADEFADKMVRIKDGPADGYRYIGPNDVQPLLAAVEDAEGRTLNIRRDLLEVVPASEGGYPEDDEPQGTAEDLRPLIEAPARRVSLTFTHPTIGDEYFNPVLVEAIKEFLPYMEACENPYSSAYTREPRYPFKATNGVVVDVLAWKTVDDIGGLPAFPFMGGAQQLEVMTKIIRESAQAVRDMRSAKAFSDLLTSGVGATRTSVSADGDIDVQHITDLLRTSEATFIGMDMGREPEPQPGKLDMDAITAQALDGMRAETVGQPDANPTVSPAEPPLHERISEHIADPTMLEAWLPLPGRTHMLHIKKHMPVSEWHGGSWNVRHVAMRANELPKGVTLAFHSADTIYLAQRVPVPQNLIADRTRIIKAADGGKGSPEAEPKPMVPTIGRRVWFYSDPRYGQTGLHVIDHSQPLDAGIVYVWNERQVNLDVTDHEGHHHAFTSVMLLQPGDAKPATGYWAEWMPFQIGQAKAAK